MAVAINRSTVAVEMYGQDEDLVAHRVVLPAGKQSLDTFHVFAVRAPEGESVEVFEEERWWVINTDEVHLYEPTPEAWSFTTNVTLHCVPPRPGTDGFEPGYTRASDELQEELDLVPLEPDLVRYRDPDDPLCPKDGELNSTHALFGKFVRTGSHITVRLDLVPCDGTDAAAVAAQKPIWKSKIEEVWNHNGVPESSSGVKFIFECDFTDKSAHYSVGIFGALPWRASMFMWPITLHPHVSAHEFGHYLGLTDSYLYDGELPHLKDVFSQLPAFKNKAESLETTYSLWTALASLWPSNSDRARKRASEGPWSGEIDIMWASVLNGVANGTITKDLIDTIDKVGDSDFDTQMLHWRESDFIKKETDGALGFVQREDE